MMTDDGGPRSSSMPRHTMEKLILTSVKERHRRNTAELTRSRYTDQ